MLSSSHGKRAALLTTLLAALALVSTALGVPDARAASPTGTLRVRITNAVTLQPVVGATISVQTWYGSPLMSGQTDAQGTY